MLRAYNVRYVMERCVSRILGFSLLRRLDVVEDGLRTVDCESRNGLAYVSSLVADLCANVRLFVTMVNYVVLVGKDYYVGEPISVRADRGAMYRVLVQLTVILSNDFL